MIPCSPRTPFEFITLLAGSSLASIRRHELISELVRRLREEPQFAEPLGGLGEDLPDECRDRFDDLVRQLGALALEGSEGATRSAALRLLRVVGKQRAVHEGAGMAARERGGFRCC